jgi:Putative Ig domain
MIMSCRFQSTRRSGPLRRDRFRILFYIVVVLMSACGPGGGSGQAPPSSISYASPAALTVGAAVTFVPTASGVATHYTISPALPPGLTLNNANGMISGSAVSAAAPTSYTITASNDNGSTSFAWMLSISDVAPVDLSYPNPLTALVGVPLSAAPSVSGAVTSYAVSPALPAGLSLDPVSGVISGTPTTASAQGSYTITASDGTGQTTFALILTVNPLPTMGSPQAPTSLAYPSPLNAVVGIQMTSAPSVNGTATSYAVSPTLPAGLILDPVSGVISGTPTAPTAQGSYTVTASNGTAQSSFTLILTVIPAATTGPPQPPTGLSYSSPLTALAGRALTAVPSVSGAVTSYAVNPALPAGLALDPVSGVISGTPSQPSAQASYTITASNGTAQTVFALILTVVPSTPNIQTGPTIQIGVMAFGQPGATLSYQWRSTDGVVQNTNSPQTTWTAPSGAGLHFVYVVVSNGEGGYAEGRVTINLDAIGRPAVIPAAQTYAAPAAPAPTGVPLRVFSYTTVNGANPAVYYAWADSNILLADYVSGTTYTSEEVDLKGSVAFQNVPLNSDPLYLQAPLAAAGYISGPSAYLQNITDPTPALEPNYNFISWNSGQYTPYYTALSVNNIVGRILQSDGTAAGINEPFFGLMSNVYIQDNSYQYETVLNEWNEFTLLLTGCSNTLYVSVDSYSRNISGCTGTNITEPPLALGTVTLPGTASPTIGSMTATYNGNSVGSFQSISPITTVVQPSDNIPQRDIFLAFKGADTRLGACNYYQAIGAVAAGACDFSGNYTSAISFEDWKRTVQIDGYAQAGAVTATATFVNPIDLNLTRVHHSVAYPAQSYGSQVYTLYGNPPTTRTQASFPVAAYVCNHPGPVASNGIPTTQQPAIDSAVAAATTATSADPAVTQNLVACVAMDYMQNAANGGVAYTRFLIFGPSGALLPSVDLDGRGEKFVPGACIACHGGDNYAGKFPEDGSGFANVGGHFLPYDAGNFQFSSAPPLTEASQAQAIYQLNQNVLGTNPTAATFNLITGIYPTPGQYTAYTPYFWTGNAAYYTNVIQKYCRTCHAAMTNVNLDAGLGLSNYPGVVCGGTENRVINHAMPNSLVTFNQLWNSTTATQQLATSWGAACIATSGP